MKLFNFIVVLNLFFILASGPAEAAKKRRWYESLNVTAGMTASLQSTTGNNDPATGTTDNTDYAYSLDLNLNSEIARGYKFFLHLETGEGNGVNDNFGTGGTTINPNYDPFNTFNASTGHQNINISQVFFESTFVDELLTVDFGKMDIHSFTDENAFAVDETSQFMAGIFVRSTGTLFTELDNYYAPGIRFLMTPAEWLEITYIAASPTNDALTKTAYHVGQFNMKLHLGGREGNYRFYFIRDGRDFAEIDGDIDSSNDTSSSNFGSGLSFDQLITEDIGMFYRFGTQKDTLSANTLSSTWSIGFLVHGSIWNRTDDFVGLGYGVTKKNEKIETTFSGSQKVLELFYHIQLTDNLSLTPDIQLFKNLPRTENREVTVYGIRLQVNFF